MATWIRELGMELTYDEVRVPVKVWDGGAVRVGKTRVSLESVLGAYIRGASPIEIAYEMFPGLEIADVYLVIGYYLTRQEEGEAYLRRCDEEWERVKAEIDAQPGQQEHRESFRARLEELGISTSPTE